MRNGFMLKRFLSLILIIFLCTSCTKQTKEEITFSSWGSVTEVNILKKAITEFENKNPNIKINFMHIPQNYFQKLHLLFASNTAPDVIFINNLYLPIYENRLMDLKGMINADEFYQSGLDAMTIDKKLLAIPRDISNLIIFYNKNYVSNPPKNFKDFDRILKQFNTKKIFGMSYERNIFYAEPFILTLGNQEGIDYYLNLEGKFAPKPSDVGSSTQAQMFLDEKIVFYVSGRWMYPKIKDTAKFPFGIIQFPGKIYADTSGWAISKNTKHPEASKKFVKFLISKKNIDYFTSSGLIVPARIDSSKQLNNTEEHAFLDAIQNSKTRKPDKHYGKNRDRINKKLFNL